ncbi:MAG: FAD-dependent oxidoreductase [Myxococcales bacterium]|nr:FAD-dependent oxidoreductase [Myxococcales bacterium]
MPHASQSRSTDVAIIGAGLTGLSAAHALEAMGRDYRLLERLPHVGGHAITLEEGGYRFDRTGHLLHLRDPRMRERVIAWVGAHVEVQRRSAVFSHGVYTRYPYQANTYGLPPEVANECLLGFIQAHFRKDKPEAKNFEEFCRLHFGDGISDHFMIPYNCRLWGVHPREITAEWCQRFVPLPKLEDVVAGAVGLNDRELGYNTHFVYPERGIGALPQGMLDALPERSRAERLALDTRIQHIDADARRLILSEGELEYQQLINTAPLDVLLSLLDLPEEVAAAAERLRCTHLYYLDIASKAPSGKPLHWVYVPEARYPFYRVGCYSNFSPAMAPAGGSCFYVELASREQPDLEQLLPDVTRGLVQMQLLPNAEALAFARLRRIDHAYVIFDHDYYGALHVIRPFLARRGIISAGRYGGWNYSSMEDALLFGERAVSELQSEQA